VIHLIDLDNCLCDDEWRIPYILWQKTNPMERYHNYHLLGAFDNIGNKSVLLQRDVEIVILTARPVFYAAATTEWLKRRHIAYKHLMMRNNNDHRKSAHVKETMLNALLQHDEYEVKKEDIKMAFDDHPAIIEMYKANGIPATQLSIHSTSAYESHEGAST
jgi:hypothetical protein